MLHIGKTGGTAVKHVLKEHLQTGTYELRLHRHGVKLSDLPGGEKVFFFVRDPLKRFVSGFYSRQRRGQPRYDVPWTPEEATAFALFRTPNELGRALSGDPLRERASAIAAMNGISHVRSSYWDWFGDAGSFRARFDDIFFIGFQERLDEDFDVLKAKLGLPAELALPIGEVERHVSPKDLDRRLDDVAIANLRAWYARDYAFLEICREYVRERQTPSIQ